MLSLVHRPSRSSPHPRSRRGLTLLELLLAIAGSVVLIITAIMLYMQATSGNKLSEAFQQVQSVTAGVRSLYSGVSGYGNDDFTETAVLARLFQNKWLEGDTPINPWGGEITLEGQGRTFTITYTAVPQDACAQLISMNSTGFGGAVRSVTVNGEDVGTQAIDPTIATEACDQDNDNEIVWEVR